MSEVLAEIGKSVSGYDVLEWDALSDGNPFTSHAFLSALEASGSVGAGSGWSPAPIIIRDQAGVLAAALPA